MKKVMYVVTMATVMGASMVGAQTTPEFVIQTPDLDLSSIATYAGVILTGLGSLWVVRKFIKVTNRS